MERHPVFMNGKTILLRWLSKLTYGFNQYNLIKMPTVFSSRNGQADDKIHMELQETQTSQNNLEKEQLRDSQFPISKLAKKIPAYSEDSVLLT